MEVTPRAGTLLQITPRQEVLSVVSVLSNGSFQRTTVGANRGNSIRQRREIFAECQELVSGADYKMVLCPLKTM